MTWALENGVKLLVLVPAYNEAEKIGETVRALRDLDESLEKSSIELKIFVVDDGSHDDTARLATEAGADHVVRHKLNRGLGAAIRSGLEAAHDIDADIVVKFDADLQHDPNDIIALIQPILDDEADIIYGNRFERIEYRMPSVRRIGNRLFTGLMRWLTGWPLKDSQPGIFAVGKSYLSKFYIPGDYNYTQQILLDAYHKGLRFGHVPVAFRKRATGKSFISMKYPLKVLPQIIMVLIGVRPLRVFGTIGIAFLLAGLGLFFWEFASWITGFSDKPVIHVNAVMGLTLFGIQTLFFGFLAHLIVEINKSR